ncbi:hypothetical protein, partial [Neorhodopirellula pilleata]|uniref:hypothetical protein n=1 Tax=Neorhodopirellula pilleata TaxID=2714738 RepID=UPI001E4A9970
NLALHHSTLTDKRKASPKRFSTKTSSCSHRLVWYSELRKRGIIDIDSSLAYASGYDKPMPQAKTQLQNAQAREFVPNFLIPAIPLACRSVD